MSEKNEVQNKSLLAVGSRPDVMVWRNQTGMFLTMDGKRPVRVGNPGAPDSLGVVRVTITPDMVGQSVGVAIGPEFKLPFTGRQSQAQKNWQSAFEARGGRYALIRSADEMVDFINSVSGNTPWK